MHNNITIDEDEFISISNTEQFLFLHIGKQENGKIVSDYCIGMNIREARRLIHDIHDCIRDLKRKVAAHETV